MKQAKFPLEMIGFLIGLLLFVGMVALSGCQSADSEAEDEAVQVTEAEQVADVAVEPELLETATAVSPTEESISEPTEEAVPIDNCLDCHTNKDLLIDTADPEEEVISENEGEG